MIKHILPVAIALIIGLKSQAQTVYLIGKLKPSQIEEITTLVSFIDNKFKYKKLSIKFQGDQVSFVYRKKQKNSSSLLDRKLSDYSARSVSFNEAQIIYSRKQIPYSANISFLYDKNGPGSKYQFSSMDQLTESLKNQNPKDKIDIILQYTPELPVVKITSPALNGYYTSFIKGTTEGKDIEQVQVRVNDGEWITLEETQNWTYRTYSQKVNRIQARAISSFKDTSAITTIDKISYKNFNEESLNYLFPNKLKNVVPKCRNNSGYSFNFKINVDNEIDISNLIIVFTDNKGNELYSEQLGKLPESAIRQVPRDGKDEYCIFLIYSVLFINPCSIDESKPFYYFYRYNQNNKMMKTAPVRIFFSSFDSDFHLDYPLCDCD